MEMREASGERRWEIGDRSDQRRDFRRFKVSGVWCHKEFEKPRNKKLRLSLKAEG